MLKSILFSLLLIVSSVLEAAANCEPIDIDAPLFALKPEQIRQLKEAMDLSVFDVFFSKEHKKNTKFSRFYSNLAEYRERLPTKLNLAEAVAKELEAGQLRYVNSLRVSARELIAEMDTLLDQGKRFLSSSPDYQLVFATGDLGYPSIETPEADLDAAQLESQTFTKMGLIDECYPLDTEDDLFIKEYYLKSRAIMESLAALVLGENPQDRILIDPKTQRCVTYIKGHEFSVSETTAFYKSKKILNYFSLGQVEDIPVVRRFTFVIVDTDNENIKAIDRSHNFILWARDEMMWLQLDYEESTQELSRLGQGEEYLLVTGDNPPEGLFPNDYCSVLAPEDPENLPFQSEFFSLVSCIFQPLLKQEREGKASGTLYLAIPLPSTPTEKVLLQMHFLEKLLEAKKDQAGSTALITYEVSEEIQVLETALEEKQAELQQAFVEENPAFIETAKKLGKDLYEREWDQRKKQVIEDTATLSKSKKKQPLAKLEKERAEREKNKAQLLQQKQNELFRKKLDILKKEAQGKFKPFYQGVKSFFESKGIDVALTQTGNSGSHTGKIEFTAQGASAGSIIVPNKKITKGLLGAICDEISALSERLATRNVERNTTTTSN